MSQKRISKYGTKVQAFLGQAFFYGTKGQIFSRKNSLLGQGTKGQENHENFALGHTKNRIFSSIF